MRRLGLALAAVAAAGSVAWTGNAAAEPPLDASQVNWDLRSPVARFYPLAASGAGVTGHAVVTCTANGKGRLTGCGITSEDPPGYDFGVVAAATAQSMRFRPADKSGRPVAGRQVKIPFGYDLTDAAPGAAPASDSAEARAKQTALLLDRSRLVVLNWPSVFQTRAALPREARLQALGGSALVVCEIGSSGAPSSCRAVAEDPGGLGFGAAAARLLMQTVQVGPRTKSGEPVAGRTFSQRVDFEAPR